jgi:hypothetical protein
MHSHRSELEKLNSLIYFQLRSFSQTLILIDSWPGLFFTSLWKIVDLKRKDFQLFSHQYRMVVKP